MSKPQNSKSVHDYCHTKYESIKDTYQDQVGNKLIISNYGDFSEDIVDSILYLVETKMESDGEPKGMIKRVFSIVVESLQNIRLHGTMDETGKQRSYIIIGKVKNDYMLSLGNLAENKAVENIKSNLNDIKGLQGQSLKKKYMETLADGKISHKGGAGLGFITIAMKSGNNMAFELEKINEDLTLFNLQVVIAAN